MADADIEGDMYGNETEEEIEIPFNMNQVINILQRITDGENETDQIPHAFIRQSLVYVYPLFVFLYGLLTVIGTAGNVAMLAVILKKELYHNPVFFFLGNMAFSDLIKSMLIVPITVTHMVVENWLFGSFLCFFVPMLHAFPNHVTILTYLLVAVDRYRFIVYPMKSRVPAGLCTIAVWVVSVCVVLPFAVYMRFYDLAQFGYPHITFCDVAHDKNIEEYMQATFVLLFCLPLACIAFLYVRVSMELQATEITDNIHIEDNSQTHSEASYHSRMTFLSGNSNGDLDNTRQEARLSTDSGHLRVYTGHSRQDSQAHEPDDGGIDIVKEKRTQKYMITMVVLFAICWFPINLLSLITHFLIEDENNTGDYDISYLTLTFLGYSSTCVNPLLFASWRMSNQTRDRLRGYFRFSNRRRSSCQMNGLNGAAKTNTDGADQALTKNT